MKPMTDPTKPEFVEVPLIEMMDEGVLLAINERVLWPLGLALTWGYSQEGHDARDLHIREWRFEDGHHEGIEVDPNDPVVQEHRKAFPAYVKKRAETMPSAEAAEALLLVDWSAEWDELEDG